MLTGFHEVLFPTGISLGSVGGPERRTEIVVLGSGAEERNSRWADSRRKYNAGYGVRTLDELEAVIAFFEERRGRLYGFRWRDPTDNKSCAPSKQISPLDQNIGIGDGITTEYRLSKTYGSAHAPWRRIISKPVGPTVRLAVAGTEIGPDAVVIDDTSGTIRFKPGHVPPEGTIISAGFLFDVPVRFDSDSLEINVGGFRHGAIPDIPLVEIRI